MINVLKYRGYHTKVECDIESGTLYGRIEGIRDFVNFEAKAIEDVEKQFHLAVDDYLSFCEEVGKNPDKEYKGSFNVRISPELHRRLALFADKNVKIALINREISQDLFIRLKEKYLVM